MINTRKIKESSYFPAGVRRIENGGLFVDMDHIKSFHPRLNYIDIEYWDGSRIIWHPVFND